MTHRAPAAGHAHRLALSTSRKEMQNQAPPQAEDPNNRATFDAGPRVYDAYEQRIKPSRRSKDMQRKLFLFVQAFALLLFTTAIGVSAAQRPDSPAAANFTDVPS